MTTSIWWIRRDLRLQDNSALAAAMAYSEKFVPLFILDPLLLNSKKVGGRRTSFLINGLRVLDRDLRHRGSRLILREGVPQLVLEELLAEVQSGKIFAQADFTPYAHQRDRAIAARLPLVLVGSPAIQAPDRILKKDGSPYTVFTPYSRQWRVRELAPRQADPHLKIRTPDSLSSVSLPPMDHAVSVLFPAGTKAGMKRLKEFASNRDAPIYEYAQNRDRIDLNGTSSLSPYLRFGMVSPRDCLEMAVEAQARAGPSEAQAGSRAWINELAWRDFYLSIIYHFPHVLKSDFRDTLEGFPWKEDRNSFARWKDGLTGFPVVDAAMRQLREIGWMHNRARMITASFLTKDLLIHWSWGESWFMEQLIDGDPASNNGGWQWVAGTGSDSSPYFRIFNPVRQSQKFDPSGNFIRRWVPELQSVPDKFIHEPWKIPEESQTEFGCRINRDYPSPMVDHQWARSRALDLYYRLMKK